MKNKECIILKNSLKKSRCFLHLLSFLLLLTFFESKAQLLVPPSDKTLLIIGQDLASIAGYYQSNKFSSPGGVTSYLNLYDCNNPKAVYPFGGMGEKLDGTAAPDVDWGAGPTNARNTGYGYPDATLAIGVYMTEEFYPGGLTAIANGQYDAEINRLGKFLKDLNKPVFLRIGYEFDGKWNIGYQNTSNFKNAYKRIVDLIRPVAPKCMMVWQSSTSPVDDLIEGFSEDITMWYPGDEYVDYMGYSWFLSSKKQFDLTNEIIDFARLRKKPVMCSEAAPQGYDLSESDYRFIGPLLGGASGTGKVAKTSEQLWNEWYKPFFDYIHTNSDVIKVVAYINCDWNSQAKWGVPYNEGYWGDSRIESNAAITTKWNAEINTNFWLHGSTNLFNILGSNVVSDPKPIVSFITPKMNDKINSNTNFSIQVDATDNNQVASVELFVDNVSIGLLTQKPYSWLINGSKLTKFTLGSHTIRAEAKDNSGQLTKKEITVEIVDPSVVLPVVSGFDIPNGKTLLMIGQVYTQEYKDYVSAMGKAPAGSSHYAEIYSGAINQGDDGNSESFLSYINSNYPNAFAQVAISIKDNPAAGGYTGHNAVWKACKAISAGKWDAQIDKIALSMKTRANIKFFVRICYEVNLPMVNKTDIPFIDILNKYNALGINPLENADKVEEFDLPAYRDAYNYIARRIRVTNKVNNAKFVFHPIRGQSDAQYLYPGDELVDYFGISIFNHDICWPTWEGANPPFNNCPQSDAMDENLKKTLDYAKNVLKKPIIISEAAAQSHLTQQATSAHFNGYLDKLYNVVEQYDVKALVYINSHWVKKGWSEQWGDSRVEKSNETLNYWKSEVLQNRYIHYESLLNIPDIDGKITSNKIKIFPNPSRRTFNLTESLNWEVFNFQGKSLNSGFGSVIDMEANSKGMYILKTESGNFKLVLE